MEKQSDEGKRRDIEEKFAEKRGRCEFRLVFTAAPPAIIRTFCRWAITHLMMLSARDSLAFYFLDNFDLVLLKFL